MFPYCSYPFVSCPTSGMCGQSLQPQQYLPQYMPQPTMYQYPTTIQQGYGQMSPGMMPINYMDTNYDVYDSVMVQDSERPNGTQPILSNNTPSTSITLFKELTGYANYGNPSGNADILYTGNRGTWTFQIPAGISAGEGNIRAQILIRAVLDDHYNVPEDRYSATITVNDRRVHSGRVYLEHGRPSGARFNNWRTLTFDIPDLRRNNRITIVNTSNAGSNDWMAFDWMELRLVPRR